MTTIAAAWLLLPCCLIPVVILGAQTTAYQPSFRVANFPDACPVEQFIVGDLEVADFNGDRVPDLAAGCIQQNQVTQISVLIGKGDGTFQSPVITSTASMPVRWSSGASLFAADVNGDGNADLIYSSFGPTITFHSPGSTYITPSCTVTLLLANGNGTFAAPNTVATNLAYCVWGVADLNGDGIPDLVLSSLNQMGFAVMLGRGGGMFSPSIVYAPQSSGLNPMAMGDFNGDGKPDVITSTNGSLAIWLNQGDGSLGTPVLIPSIGGFQGLAADFNGDGKLDLGVVTIGGISVVLGNGNGTFQQPLAAVSAGNQQIGVDLTGNGRTDLVGELASYDGGGVVFSLANADGSLDALPPANFPVPLVTADFNGDGKADMAGFNKVSGQVMVMINGPVSAAFSWTMKSPQTSPPARSDHAMAYDSVHAQIVLFGGLGQVLYGDTWVWDGSNWTEKSSATSPPGRYGHAMAFDSAHGRVVLFGGVRGSALNDTWLWDGTTWTQTAPQTSPPERLYPAMAFDSKRGEVVLFGGETDANNGTLLNDTWVWDGSDWTEKKPPTSPTARRGPAMAYDSAHDRMVLFGGANETAAYGETWLWDGSEWTNVMAQNQPTQRSLSQMAYDAADGETVMFGGEVQMSSTLLLDTQVWDGTNWAAEYTFSDPSPRGEHAMAYDSGHNQLVLFGGAGLTAGGEQAKLGDTWIWGPLPPATAITAVVNGASFAGGGVAPGEIATAFGTNLTSSTGINVASSLPLPGTFLTDTLMVNGQLAALFAVDNVNGQQQINFQVPWQVPSGTSATFAAKNNGVTGASISIPVVEAQPGIFNYSAGGETFGAILHANYQLADARHPAKPRETVLIYCTGLGAVSSPPADGTAGAGQPTTHAASVTIGGQKANVSFSGLAPGFVGLYQINVAVPTGLGAGNQPVVVAIAGASSNVVLLPVQ